MTMYYQTIWAHTSWHSLPTWHRNVILIGRNGSLTIICVYRHKFLLLTSLAIIVKQTMPSTLLCAALVHAYITASTTTSHELYRLPMCNCEHINTHSLFLQSMYQVVLTKWSACQIKHYIHDSPAKKHSHAVKWRTKWITNIKIRG